LGELYALTYVGVMVELEGLGEVGTLTLDIYPLIF